MQIDFYSNHPDLYLCDEDLIRRWISVVVDNHSSKVGKITYRFCDDEEVYNTNVTFLSHDTYTDIITFDYSVGNTISGDIIISVDRVRDNAINFGVSFDEELHRVIIHGILHLLGFKDKKPEDATVMRSKEKESLDILTMLQNC